jgi:ribosomal protein L29
MAKAPTTTAPNLQVQIDAKRAELLETKRSHAAGELVNPRALGRIRKEIARLHTELNKPDSKAPVKETKEEEKK